ncbi:fatty acid cis/trans isomerase [Saccharophagus degradans]|uniref:fatty acid cis/trans isomerase n=1 Tax=Saccharophagus degradans TaxID=86304 RepID=UPI0024781A4F|nr:fatty acid cis/trans isomerase [Saccharophagus degradans]WGO98213.1 fatty acid cis/trans isomerase [Saccharophagus degradans]
MLRNKTSVLFIAIALTAMVAGLSYYYIQEQREEPAFTVLPHNTVHEEVNYYSDIQPILDQKCVACHSCFDAPCQLKLVNAKGLLRGATAKQVYNGGRTEPQQPTRLNLDGNTEAEWRNLGFHSVLETNNQSPLLKSFIAWGFATQNSENANTLNEAIKENNIELGTTRENQCSATTEEFNRFTHSHPHNGMPLATQGLSQPEYDLVMTWFEQGATIPDAPWTINKQDKGVIQKWEDWLNETSNERKLLARYIYEHLFLAHLYLQPDDKLAERILDSELKYPVNFYRLVRSSTPSGTAISPINTALPNQPPQSDVYYRLLPVEETIVYKSHIPYRFDKNRLTEIESLFTSESWKVEDLPSYDYEFRSNPFKTYNAIPAKLRYKFLLQDAEYFVRTFIRGPVCHGPIATDVIRDHFWVMFENPETELFVNNKNYRQSVESLLGLPGENSQLSEFGDEWTIYQNNRNKYAEDRNTAYRQSYNTGRPLNTIWTEKGENPNAFLTVFRHHNNATVLQGWQGSKPRTAWVLDYPLFERTYYELVAGFDVFGNVSHQLQTRLYFDLIRHGGETNFLAYMPKGSREAIFNHWYQGLAQLKTSISYPKLDTLALGAPELNESAPKDAFFNYFFDKFPSSTNAHAPINRAETSTSNTTDRKEQTHTQSLITTQLASIASKPAKELAFIEDLPDLSLLIITSNIATPNIATSNIATPNIATSNNVTSSNENQSIVYSLVRNRMHSNVAFLTGEELRYQPEQDYLSIQKGLVGSYPNLIFKVDESDINRFISALNTPDNDTEFRERMDEFILKRLDDNFWETVHAISNAEKNRNPISSGLLDLNRYGSW